jgi:hypothetical protein
MGRDEAMSGGFNTNVHVGERVFHVQTEFRARTHAKIDTAVYFEGLVVHRQSTPYADGGGSTGNDSERRHAVEQQHRGIIESLRSGSLQIDENELSRIAKLHKARAIAVTLLNSSAWVAGGYADLKIAVQDRKRHGVAVPGARVEASLEGINSGETHNAVTDAEGHAGIRFALPPGGIAGAALVIRAISPAGEDEIRFQLRPKSKAPAAKK